MGLNRGFGELYRTPPANVGGGTQRDYPVTLPAQVLEVCLDPSSPLYSSESSIGSVRVKLMGPGLDVSKRYEEEATTIAFPIDRTIVKYPLPGEQVMLHLAAGDIENGSIFNIQEDMPTFRVYYSYVVAANLNPTYNSNPFFASTQTQIKRDGLISRKQAEVRFDKEISDLDSFKQENKVKIYKQLKPFEGDFILQGRFGNTIRFGCSSIIENKPWTGGTSGDPVMVLRVDREMTTDSAQLLVQENINSDDSSMYLCSNQKVEVQLSCSSLKSWNPPTTSNISKTSDSEAQAVAAAVNSINTDDPAESAKVLDVNASQAAAFAQDAPQTPSIGSNASYDVGDQYLPDEQN